MQRVKQDAQLFTKTSFWYLCNKLFFAFSFGIVQGDVTDRAKTPFLQQATAFV